MATTEATTVLDNGYVRLVEAWGSDERIVEAARMSTAKGFLGWGPKCRACGDAFDGPERACPQPAGKPYVDAGRGGHVFDAPGDEKLLQFLWDKQHATPFEMAGLTIEVKAPLVVFREWHRHRTQCLGPNTLVHFDAPKSEGDRRYLYKIRIEDLWKRWQPTVRRDRPERQVNSFGPRERVQAMRLRCADEEAREIGHTRILDVIRGEPKPMVTVTTTSGRALTATREHRVLTSVGWMTLGEALARDALLAMEGTTRGQPAGWEVPPVDEAREQWLSVAGGWGAFYEVSDMGRVRRRDCPPKRATIGPGGYPVVSLNRPGQQVTRTVHSLVAEAFLGGFCELPPGHEVRHRNHNRWDARLENLTYGTAADNSRDRVEADRNQRLAVVFEQIVSVADAGELPTFDLSVEGPWHNFVAGGFVVHNSYNEMSARYIPLPDDNYAPSVERILVANQGTTNKQAQGSGKAVAEGDALAWLAKLDAAYVCAQEAYELGLALGVPKELARLSVPVGRYSAMRASANLRNWLGFLKLRCDSAAQWEIRQYANAVAGLVKAHFPRTHEVARDSLGLP
jgi:thymidylate synthase (FAD)